MSTCEFCGQVLIDGKMCDCPRAVAERKKEQIIGEAQTIVEETFAAGSEPLPSESIEMLKDVCALIANGYIRKVSVLLKGGIKANIKTAAKAKIEVERIDTTKFKAETETEL